MKYFVYIQRSIILFAIAFLFVLLFFLSYYRPNTPNTEKLLTPTHSYLSTDENIKKFIDTLEEPIAPIQLHAEEFKKNSLFE